ncbi:NAD(P)/FAD-dependent oxidoreductase [Actinokineospora xionganensis]|uniref:FAD-dependent oxidoreductase n=1 Tax=Actinokineospora xionganensis TaxID=2684470 RepID=A0ABR7LA35_9PSEU|nr:NAD(P)/FAD-dependent oxidoreductase [Actinokineospora xionganensis]MBC6449548.1 FAD-dependent oxidoreductase [Actinokineospora xionganensis]
MTVERIVVVGAGAAGFRAAERLRQLGFDGEVVMIGDEPRKPYHRPAVCKALLCGSRKARDVTLEAAVELDVGWRLGTRAIGLDTARHAVLLPGGEEVGYDGLILATGGYPRSLPGAPRHDPRVRVLRTVEDAEGVQAALRTSRLPAVVVGGGFIGCEFAASMRAMGREVIVVNNSAKLLHRFGDAIADAAGDLHAGHRVDTRSNARIRKWDTGRDGVGLHLDNGDVVFAACVVLAVGSTPSVEWLRGSGLRVDDGVFCEPTLFAAGVDDVAVAGDIARWPNLRFDPVPRRVEHWITAVEGGRAAAENLLAGKWAAKPFTPLPRAWTSQFDVRVQHVGMPALATDTVPLDAGVTGFVRAGNLVAVATWDRPHAMLDWTATLDRLLPVPTAGRRPRARPPRDGIPARVLIERHYASRHSFDGPNGIMTGQ